jgi:hypothetical protein
MATEQKDFLLSDSEFVRNAALMLSKLSIREPVTELDDLRALVKCRDLVENPTTEITSKLNTKHLLIFLRRVTTGLPVVAPRDQQALAQLRVLLEESMSNAP